MKLNGTTDPSIELPRSFSRIAIDFRVEFFDSTFEHAALRAMTILAEERGAI